MVYQTAYERWAGVGPYYAMFPLNFVREVVLSFTKQGDRILDPFAGRASSIFAGASLGRPSIGIEINPVGWVYGKTKLAPANPESLKKRLVEIASFAQELPNDRNKNLPDFFDYCYSKDVLRFLVAARNNLRWQHDTIDRTLMAFILIDLHGGRHRSLSNQMRQSKAMSPEYSIQWWKQRGLIPPQRDPQSFLEKKINWRYAKGLPDVSDSDVLLGDSCFMLSDIQAQAAESSWEPFTLLLTSPPYIGISDYHRDQWLRLWMLGGKPLATRNSDRHKRDFSSSATYKELLNTVFLQAAGMMSEHGTVYVRTDAREQTFEITREVLRLAFPRWHETIIDRPYTKQTQTALYGDKTQKVGEKDIILVKR